MSVFKEIARLWNNINIFIVSDGAEFYALNGWNGEKYTDCWKVLDPYGLDIDPMTEHCTFEFKPIYQEITDDDFEIIGFEKLY